MLIYSLNNHGQALYIKKISFAFDKIYKICGYVFFVVFFFTFLMTIFIKYIIILLYSFRAF